MGVNGMGLPMMPMFPGGMPYGMNAQDGGTYDPHEAQLDMRSPIVPEGSSGLAGAQAQGTAEEASVRENGQEGAAPLDPMQPGGEGGPSLVTNAASSSSLQTMQTYQNGHASSCE